MLSQLLRRPVPLALLLVRRVAAIPTKGLPNAWRSRNDEFDRKFGVETAKIVHMTAPGSANFLHGTRYEPSPEAAIRWSIEQCELPLVETTFVDVGCGKGRALIAASQYPFKKIIGVEYSAELVGDCRRNLEKLNLASRCEVILKDAADYQFPGGSLFTFFYNPFDAIVHSVVLDNLSKTRRRVVIAHRGPGHGVITDWGKAREVCSNGDTRLYEVSREDRPEIWTSCADAVSRFA